LLRKILDELVKLGFIAETLQESDTTAYQPARALEKIRLHDVIRSLAVDGADYSHLRDTPERLAVGGVAEILHDAEQKALEGMTLRDLVLQVEEAEDRAEVQGIVASADAVAR
jgi:DNA-binding IscR family transcriptional regulator